MKIDPVKKAPVPAISGEDLVATVPEIAQVAHVEVENLSNVPSAYMDPDRWVQLQKSVTQALARPEVAGVIVSHGTDTLEETAWFLDLTVDNAEPPHDRVVSILERHDQVPGLGVKRLAPVGLRRERL